MSDYSSFDLPGVRITVDDSAHNSSPELEYVHLDDIDELDHTKKFTLYVFSDEDRYNELSEAVNEHRQNYVFATGIVWPSWMRDEMPLETDVLLALEWAIAFDGELTPELLESVQNELRQEANHD